MEILGRAMELIELGIRRVGKLACALIQRVKWLLWSTVSAGGYRDVFGEGAETLDVSVRACRFSVFRVLGHV